MKITDKFFSENFPVKWKKLERSRKIAFRDGVEREKGRETKEIMVGVGAGVWDERKKDREKEYRSAFFFSFLMSVKRNCRIRATTRKR